jgi:Glycosyltransferase family 9 (heptosyltransferase)
VGYGDDILGSGLARGLCLRGKRAAFGDGKHIIWGPWSEEIFRHNPHVARPGDERANDIEWIGFYKGKRLYNKLDKTGTRWNWNYDFKAAPGELFFDRGEIEYAERAGQFFVVIEPNVPWHKSVAPNKDWGFARYQQVANRLLLAGHDVVQFSHGRDRLRGVRVVKTPTFRHALAVLNRASTAVLPEGGLHHGAAALGIPAVVIFGGFIPPQVTGYAMHINLNGNADACGSLQRCQHCRDALDRITVDEVCGHVLA